MKTILLDADGVFVNFVKGYLDIIERVTGKRFTEDQITEFDIGKALGLSEADMRDVYNSIQTGFCKRLEPLPGAIEAIQRIMLNHNVYVVTSPWTGVDTWDSERRTWIKVHLGLDKSRVLSGSAKHLVRGDFFIDDKAENCVDWQDANPNGTAVMWRSPWNQNHPWPGWRFNKWAALEALIDGDIKRVFDQWPSLSF